MKYSAQNFITIFSKENLSSNSNSYQSVNNNKYLKLSYEFLYFNIYLVQLLIVPIFYSKDKPQEWFHISWFTQYFISKYTREYLHTYLFKCLPIYTQLRDYIYRIYVKYPTTPTTHPQSFIIFKY